jgi:hypothetical protein
MARPKIHKKPSRVHLTLPSDLKKQASRRAFEMGLGGLSELVSRLLVAELTTRNIASKYNRNLNESSK